MADLQEGVKMIKLELEVPEVNGILTALGQMPFVQVQSLIAKIQGQAAPQVQPEAPEVPKAE
jgi:hypothetical protein